MNTIPKNNNTVAIVIPVYNEEKAINACIDAILIQSESPNEVIVVDNNSTDDTLKKLKKYKNIKILYEEKQGQRFAQKTGFNAVNSEIIIRIDADTILPQNYISKSKEILKNSDIDGICGYGISRYEFIPYISLPWNWFYFTYTQAYFGYYMLWGANTVFRTEYWHKARDYMANDNTERFHEDQDLSLALVSVGAKLAVTSELIVSVQMGDMLRLSHYHSYVTMMRELKKYDKLHERFKLDTRLKPTPILKRSMFWLVSAWTVYGFYIICAIYSLKCNIQEYLKTH